MAAKKRTSNRAPPARAVTSQNPSAIGWRAGLFSLLRPSTLDAPLIAKRRAADTAAAVSTPAPSRLPLFDLLRGIAIVAMIAYHFAFDLNFFGVFKADFHTDERLLAIRNTIVTMFLLLVGISLTLAFRNGIRWPRYLKRLLLLALSALAVSVGSALVFPHSWIFFGVLHFILAASILALAFRHAYRANLLFGTAAIVFGLSVAHPAFDAASLNWIGLTTAKPVTEDYVPLLPWFGVVLIGMFLGKLGLRRIDFSLLAERQPTSSPGRALVWLGRHSLVAYLVHQPILFALLWAGMQLF